MTIHETHYYRLYEYQASFNIELWSEILEDNNTESTLKTSKKLLQLLDILGLSYPAKSSPFNALVRYFNLKFNKDSELILNDTELSTIMTSLLHIKQLQGQLVIFTDKGWITISEISLNQLIIAISVVIFKIQPPSSSRLKQVREYLKGNAPEVEGLVTREYIQVINGCFDIKECIIVTHSPERIPKIRLNVDLADLPSVKEAQVPKIFQSFLMQVVNQDEGFYEYLLDVYASLLDLSAPLHAKGVVLFGPGGNGKSVLMNLLESFFLIDNIAVKSLDDMGKNFGLENFSNAMINISHELSSSRPKAESIRQLKRLLDLKPGLTEIDEKFKNLKKMVIDLKMIFASNTVLSIDNEQKEPLRRRIIILPFNHTPENIDPDLTDKLIQEKELILNFLLRRIHEIHVRSGLSEEPEVVTTTNNLWFSTESYIANNPTLSADVLNWLGNNIERHEGSRVDRAELNRKIMDNIDKVTPQLCNNLIQNTLNYKEVKVDGQRSWRDMRLKKKIINIQSDSISNQDYMLDEYY